MMNIKHHFLSTLVLILAAGLTNIRSEAIPSDPAASAEAGFVNAAQFGFSPEASGLENTKALQRAVDQTGTIIVSQPGTYKIADTVFLGSNTSLVFGNNVFLKKVDERGGFSHVLLNKGALTKTYDQNITVTGLHIIVNGMDLRKFLVYGLHGQLAFFYVKDLRIDRFRCLDLGKAQYGIHVCSFEDIIINDVIIKGDKDGVHLGRGKRFTISHGTFQTYDDAVALNAHDYDVGNPELGWIEDGVVENCHDLADGKKPVGYFCRILAGAWVDWHAGMEVQKSDTVVSNGRLYRVFANANGAIYKSTTQPSHESGPKVLDGITWVVVQNDVTYTAGVRNIAFRDIFLEKPRIGFSIHFDNDKYSRSYYPGALIPMQEQLTFDNIRVLHDQKTDFLSIGTPVDVLTIANSSFKNNGINFHGNKAMPDYLKTKINLLGCVFNQKGIMDLVTNSVPNKEIVLKTSSNLELHDDFSAKVTPGTGKITVESDLTGLKK
jgi:polygalacturonase